MSPGAVTKKATAKAIYCPRASQLIRKDMWWGYGSWRSYDQSFVRKIKAFVGAQWIGVGVGTMICVYKGEQATSFPVTV